MGALPLLTRPANNRGMAPPQFQAKSIGPFPLRGGPLCGLRTDRLPETDGCIGLVYDNTHRKQGHEWMCVYRFVPEWPGYEFKVARVILD
jgi:hypothetical protein